MKKYFLTILLAIAVIPSFAEVITTMNIHRTDGSVLYIPLNTIDSITYSVDRDVNCPRITNVQVSQEEVEGGTNFTIRVVAESRLEVNWLTICLDSPNGNMFGGGGTTEFIQIGDGLWEHVRTDFISQYMPNGEYRYSCIQVGNTGSYESEYWGAEPILVLTTHNSAASKPIINNVTLTSEFVNDAYYGKGTNLTLTVVATSDAPLEFFTCSLDGPNGNLFGGGGTAEFTEISAGVYEYKRTDFLTEWLPNGEYYYSYITVQNSANLESDAWEGEVKTTITGHKDGITKPVIANVTLTTESVNNVEQGTGTNLTLTVVATSNAPLTFFTCSLDGPNGNLFGGGGTAEFTEISTGVYEYTRTDFISSDYPSGRYWYSYIQVTNAANLESDAWTQTVGTVITNE